MPTRHILKDYNFCLLKKIKFVAHEKNEYGEYQFFQYNNEIFIVNQFEYHDDLIEKQIIECDEYAIYCYWTLDGTENSL